jgi:hypothetical protein
MTGLSIRNRVNEEQAEALVGQLITHTHTSRFPRTRRFVLGERVERNLYDLPETLIQAKYTRQRQALLRRSNLKLETLRLPGFQGKVSFCIDLWSWSIEPRTTRSRPAQ